MAYDASGDVVGVDGVSRALPLRVVGSFVPAIPFKVSGAGASTSTDAITITFPQLKSIAGWVVDVYALADGSKASDDAISITVSGNVMTITELSAGVIEANRYQGLVWGPAQLV